jgi:hypothetical protein
MTVRQLLSSLDSTELAEWAAFFKIEEERREERSGNRPKKVSSPYTAMHAMFGARIVKGQKDKDK